MAGRPPRGPDRQLGTRVAFDSGAGSETEHRPSHPDRGGTQHVRSAPGRGDPGAREGAGHQSRRVAAGGNDGRSRARAAVRLAAHRLLAGRGEGLHMGAVIDLIARWLPADFPVELFVGWAVWLLGGLLLM